MTAHGPPSNCSSAECSFSLKTNPRRGNKDLMSTKQCLKNMNIKAFLTCCTCWKTTGECIPTERTQNDKWDRPHIEHHATLLLIRAFVETSAKKKKWPDYTHLYQLNLQWAFEQKFCVGLHPQKCKYLRFTSGIDQVGICHSFQLSAVLTFCLFDIFHRAEAKTSLPWVHLRKMEADTPPLEGLPQTRSTTSLFNSDMTSFNVGCSSVQQPRGDRTVLLRPTCQLSSGLTVLFSGQVESVALATRNLCGTVRSDSTGWLQTGG